MKEVISQLSTMGLFNKKKAKKPTKAELNKVAQRHREFKVMMYGGLCGLILAITPILAIGLTPGNITKDYLSGQILFSNSSGGTSTSTLSNLIDTRLNAIITMPLSQLIVNRTSDLQRRFDAVQNRIGTSGTYTVLGLLQQQQRAVGGVGTHTLGSLLFDVQQRLVALANHVGAPYRPTPITPPSPSPIAGSINVSPNSAPGVYVAQNGSNNQTYTALEFIMVPGDDYRLDTLTFDIATFRGTADQLIERVELQIFDQQNSTINSVQQTTIGTADVTLTGINQPLIAGQSYQVTVIAFPAQVTSGRAQHGSEYAFTLADNVFQDTTKSTLVSLTQSAPVTASNTGVFGDSFIIQQAIPVINTAQLGSNLLSATNQEVMVLNVGKIGIGTLEIGDGLNNTLFRLELISTGNVDVDSCEIRDNSNTSIASVSGLSGQLQAGAPLFVDFNEASFSSGKRITGGTASTGSGNTYTVFCNVPTVAPNSSLQASVGNFSPNGFAILDNDTSLIDISSRILGLPAYGTAKITP